MEGHIYNINTSTFQELYDWQHYMRRVQNPRHVTKLKYIARTHAQIFPCLYVAQPFIGLIASILATKV